jgi:aminoglycoside phosphotransferase (APT) family kinase protein
VDEKKYADQSVYFFFLPGEKFPSAVGKVGFDAAGAYYLEREHRSLQSINSLNGGIPPGSFPRPLLFREVSGRRFLLQSALRGEKVVRWIASGTRATARLSRFLAWAADWSASLGLATRGEAAALVPVWTEEFTRKLDRTGKSRALLEAAAREVWDRFDGSFPSVLAHGDFCGENILEHEGRYGVIDWELCDEISLPLYDILDLCLWIVFRIEGKEEADPFGALERLLNGNDTLAHELRSALGRYARRMGLPKEALPPMATLAWARYCLKKFQYLPRDEMGNFARARAGVRKILETPAGVLAGERVPL